MIYRIATIGVLMTMNAVSANEPTAGAAVIDITPPVGFPMWGYAARHDLASQGVLDRLKARALVIRVEGKALAIVSLDLGRAPHRESMARIRESLKKAGIENLIAVASHTHHGPILELDDWPDQKTPYTKQLESKIEEVILAASNSAKPCLYGVTTKEVPWNRNRQSKLPDAPVDRGLTIIKWTTLDGHSIAHLVHFAAHPVITDGKELKFSADFPGAMADEVEAATSAPCLYLQGAAGDLSPALPFGIVGAKQFGRLLGKRVVELESTLRCDSTPGQLSVVRDEFHFAPRIDVGNPLVKLALAKAFFPELVKFYDREYRGGVRPEMTTALLDRRIGLVGVSGELFCGHALQLQKRARLDYLLTMGYCNDYQQYFPTIEACAEGGYGTQPPVAMAEIGAGEQIMNKALIRLFEMRGK